MDFSLLTPQNFVVAVAFLFVCYEAYDKITKIIARITAEHDRMKKWDEMEDKLLKNIQDERDNPSMSTRSNPNHRTCRLPPRM